MGTGLEQGCRRLIFFLLLKKSSSKLTKGTILKKLEELFEESIIGIFKKKKIWQFKTHKNGESISENKILKQTGNMRIDYCCTLPSQCNCWRIRPHWAYCPNLVMRLLVTFQLKSLLKTLWTIKNRVKCPKFFKAAKIKTENKTTKKNNPSLVPIWMLPW